MPDYGYGMAMDPRVEIHRFGSANAKIEQRFLLGAGAKVFTVRRAHLNETERIALRDFWESHYGPYGAFTYNAPDDDGDGTTAYTCRFANEPLSWSFLADEISTVGINLIEIPTTSPTYTVGSTVTRFPSSALETALLSQVQEIIPLIKIQPRESGYPTIYVSDRRCTVGGQLYQARLLDFDGISQGISGESDEAKFDFGNADRVMRDLANDTDLNRAEIEFSLYHVGTEIKLDLWKGEIKDWDLDAGPVFPVSAADGIYELNLPYPTRKISRSCWKCYDDGNGCPYTAESTGLDTTNFPSVSASECDKGYDSPNGCLAHGMKHYFGGILATPQSVRVKDNSTGVWGFGRSTITSATILSSSIYDQVVPEIYTDDETWEDSDGNPAVGMPVPCKIAMGREESDFYEALGIVGEGPLEFTVRDTEVEYQLFYVKISKIKADTPLQKLDGQYNHGYPGTEGLRTIQGTDPAGAADYFSLDVKGNAVGGDFRKAYSGGRTYDDNFAAGTAFVVIRRDDEKGIQLSYPREHEMEANVLKGLQGWVWTAAGARSEQVLTNPIWIAVNMLLRARGLRYSSAAVAEQYFDVDAAIAAAAICDDTVDKLIGTGTETQFKFRGILQEEKPLRDWMQEILMNCLGYYTFSFGKMKFGIRNNSSVEEAFTEGNILFQSLQLSPMRPGFNHLTANFGDREFNFAGNSVSIYDMDHAQLIGGSTAPQFIKSNVNLSGTCTKSQAARIITTRLREELGGIDADDWKAARKLTFKTTVLALAVEPGMVCSMTHEEMPGGGPGEFRVTGWRLNKDYSIDIAGRTTGDDMYDMVVGPKPADVLAVPTPKEIINPPAGLVWHPGKETPLSGDPMFDTGDQTFSIARNYNESAQQLEFIITGNQPVNSFIEEVLRPIIRGYEVETTGGSLEGGKSYYIAICARDSNGEFSPISNMLSVYVEAGTDTNKITLYDIEWPVGTFAGYEVFIAADEPKMMCHQLTNTGTPSSIEISAALDRSTWSLPSASFDHLRAKIKRITQIGIAEYEAGTVATNSITCPDAIGDGVSTSRDISVIAAVSDEMPLLNFDITAFNNSTGEFSVTPDPVAAGVVAGDRVIVRAMPPAETATTSISDSGLALTVDAEIGNLVRIISGTGRGQVRRITDNTATVLTIAVPWDTNPDATSRFIIERPAWDYISESNNTKNRLYSLNTSVAAPVPAVLDTHYLVQVVAVDAFGTESPDELAPVREVYIDQDSLAYIELLNRVSQGLTEDGLLQPELLEQAYYENLIGHTGFLESWEKTNALDHWDTYVGFSGTAEITTGGVTGNRVFQATGKMAKSLNYFIPYNKSWLYKLSAKIKVATETEASNLLTYVGLWCFDADKAHLGIRYTTFECDLSGESDWVDFSGWVTGEGAANNHNVPVVEPTDPQAAITGTKYVKPFFVLNYNDTSPYQNVTQVDCFQLQIYDEDGQIRLYGAIDSDGNVKQSALNIANKDWGITCAFSVTDADTVAWGAGSLKIGDTTYSIDAGNSGNMSAKTYIYFDLATSTTVLQTTTTKTTAVGSGKLLIAVAQNGTGEATFDVLDSSGRNINASEIVAGSITANELAAGSVTAGKIDADAVTATEIDVSTLSAISADMGTITAGTITGGTVQTDAAANTGVKMNSSGIQGYDASNNETFDLDASDGSLTLAEGMVSSDRGDPSSYDFYAASFTFDATWRELDLSSVVPAGHHMVILRIATETNGSATFSVKRYGNTNDYNVDSFHVPSAQSGIKEKVIINCDSDRKIYYKGTSAFYAAFNVIVGGSWK